MNLPIVFGFRLMSNKLYMMNQILQWSPAWLDELAFTNLVGSLTCGVVQKCRLHAVFWHLVCRTGAVRTARRTVWKARSVCEYAMHRHQRLNTFSFLRLQCAISVPCCQWKLGVRWAAHPPRMMPLNNNLRVAQYGTYRHFAAKAVCELANLQKNTTVQSSVYVNDEQPVLYHT